MGYQIGLARISDDQSEGNDMIETLRHPPKGSSGRTYSEYDVAHEVADLEFVKGSTHPYRARDRVDHEEPFSTKSGGNHRHIFR